MPVIMSKPIQMPQGVLWDRWVVAPSPFQKRSTSRGTPTARMAAAATLKGVTRLRTYSRGRIPSRIFSCTNEGCAGARISAMGLLLPGGGLALPFPAAAREGVEPHEQGRPERHHQRGRRQRARDQLGIRLPRHAALERQEL